MAACGDSSSRGYPSLNLHPILCAYRRSGRTLYALIPCLCNQSSSSTFCVHRGFASDRCNILLKRGIAVIWHSSLVRRHLLPIVWFRWFEQAMFMLDAHCARHECKTRSAAQSAIVRDIFWGARRRFRILRFRSDDNRIHESMLLVQLISLSS